MGKYKTYEKYRPSRVEWLGEVPQDWEIRKLKFASPNSSEKLAGKPEGVAYIGLENIESKTGRLLLESPTEVVDSIVSVFHPGDVLFGKLRPYLAKVFYSDLFGVCTSELMVLRPISEVIDGKYLSYLLLSDGFISLVNSTTYGAKMPRANSNEILNIQICRPSLDEQKLIARFLDRETTRIDTLITKKRQFIDLLQKKRDVIIHQAITQGLDSTVPLKESSIPWIGKIPENWEVRKLKFIASSLGVGVVIQPSSYVEEDGGEIPFILGSDISEGHINVENARRISRESNLKLKQTILRANDLVCVRVGEPGVTAVVPSELDGINCASVMIVRQAKSFDSYWLCYVMNSIAGKANITLVAYGAAQKQFNISHAVDFLYPFPPSIEDQKRITAKLDQKLQLISKPIQKIKEQLEELTKYRKSLITAAVTGKIDVREEEFAQ
ncbi:MAG: restriction endonuclease subunit S [Aphanocapsa sp. GSE-SYN-MK-11-07L]|jgi:type I restriction enzyme S subunit|nr:restriction endonuclease subunit S [Aphanocapsa sp. GSE-SYN-MK-11-07L]